MSRAPASQVHARRWEWEQRSDFRDHHVLPPCLVGFISTKMTPSHLSFVCGLSAARSRLGGAPAGRQGRVARRPRPSGLAAGAPAPRRAVEAQRPLPAPAPRGCGRRALTRAARALLAGWSADPPLGGSSWVFSTARRGFGEKGDVLSGRSPPPLARRLLPKGACWVDRVLRGSFLPKPAGTRAGTGGPSLSTFQARPC